MPTVTYVFKTGRKEDLLKNTVRANDFFYGAKEFKKLGFDVNVIEFKKDYEKKSKFLTFFDRVLIKISGFPFSTSKLLTFKNFKTAQQDSNLSDAKIASTNFSNDPKGWLLLTGATGVGKTHLAVAIAGNRIRDFKSIYFGFLPNILEKLRNFNNNQPDNYFNFLHFVANSEKSFDSDFIVN